MRPGSAWWLEEALDHEDHVAAAPPLIGAHTADAVVVGARYAGLWTALMLLDNRMLCCPQVLQERVERDGK